MRTKYYLKKWLTAACLLAAVSVNALNAYDVEVNGIYYSIIVVSDDSLHVAVVNNDIKEPSGDVAILSSITYNGKTYDVKSISGFAFEGCSGLTSITIPSSVKTIEQFAF